MARSSALRVVSEEPEEPRGDYSMTQEAVAAWNAGQRKCRARGRHMWMPYTVYEHRSYYDVVEQCRDCKNRHRADFIKTANGGVRKEGKWVTDGQRYRESGYLLPKGAARIDDDLKDGLVAEDILSRRIIEVPDDDDSEE